MASSAGKRSRTRTKRFNEAEEEFSDDYLEEDEDQPKRKRQKTAPKADDEFKSTTPKKEGAKRGRKKKEPVPTEESTNVATSTDSAKPEESGAGEESKAGETKLEEVKPVEQEQPAEKPTEQPATTDATMADATAPTTEAKEAEPVTEPKEELHTETMRTDHDIPLTREMTVVEPEKPEEKPEEKKEEEPQLSAEEKEKQAKEVESSILEKGIIYFFYRPKVDVDVPECVDDVQKLYLLLCPGLGPKEPTEITDRTKRLIVIGRKQLPDIKNHGRYWGFVEHVSTNVKSVVDNLKEEKYETPVTEQERTLPPARLAGRGIYGIIDHHSHSHLAYVLEFPEAIGAVQKAFNIAPEGSYIVSVKNPKQGAAYAGLAPERRAKYPEELQEVFEDRRWNRLNPVKLLDYEGCELFIMGAHDDLEAELGQAGKKIEELEEKDVKHLTDRKVFNHLALSKNKTPVEPLLSGEWA